jgi:hypothetical protein
MKNANKTSFALLNDLTQGYGLAQACKKNEITSVKDLNECVSFRSNLGEKLNQRFGRDWKDTAAKIFRAKVDETPTPPAPDAERDTIIARLTELKIGFNPKTTTEKLKEILARVSPPAPAAPDGERDALLAEAAKLKIEGAESFSNDELKELIADTEGSK